MFVFWCLLYWCLLSGLWSFKEDLVRARRVQPHTAATAATAATGITWPPAIRVESVSPSAPVPPAYICPITMGPMANPAITPRGTSYDREALCDWIAKEHRYPGGEGPGTLEIDQIAPNYALRELLEAWVATDAATGATDTRDMD